ncbi:Protein argonaute, N-terminal [Dillenia turbinata]|uniref:Protein argonaute, N-terminal n=1 Tax=Dillenia turbinata TaxID=194707 RepID=A0AAN8V8S6_9MAGN
MADDFESLPPPAPVIPPNTVPDRIDLGQDVAKKPSGSKRVPMARKGLGTTGQKINLLTNYFEVGVAKSDQHFYHYNVALYYEDGRMVETKGIGRRVLDKVHEIYPADLGGKDFAYDGEKALFTLGSLPFNKMEFRVVLDNPVSTR